MNFETQNEPSYNIRMRMGFAVQRPDFNKLYLPQIEPVVYSRPIKEKLFIIKRIGIIKFIELYKIERLMCKKKTT